MPINQLLVSPWEEVKPHFQWQILSAAWNPWIDGVIVSAIGLRTFIHPVTALAASATAFILLLRVSLISSLEQDFSFWPYIWYVFLEVSQKTGFAKFSTIIGAYAVIYLISIIITAVTGSTVIIWLPMIFAFLCQLALRLYVVRKENIMDCGSSPLIGEFCCGFWCWYCSVAQSKRHFLNTKVYVLLIIIFRFCVLPTIPYDGHKQMPVARHLYGYTKVLDGDGDPDRPDGYTPSQV